MEDCFIILTFIAISLFLVENEAFIWIPFVSLESSVWMKTIYLLYFGEAQRVWHLVLILVLVY